MCLSSSLKEAIFKIIFILPISIVTWQEYIEEIMKKVFSINCFRLKPTLEPPIHLDKRHINYKCMEMSLSAQGRFYQSLCHLIFLSFGSFIQIERFFRFVTKKSLTNADTKKLIIKSDTKYHLMRDSLA